MELPEPAIGDWAVPPPNDGIGLSIDSAKVHLTGERLRSAQAGYFGLIDHISTQLYRLIAEFTIKSRQTGRPWMIVFTSDHGEMLGDHYYFRKTLPYEGSARTPLLIQGSPQLGFRSGRKCARPVCLEDLNPTLLEVAGAEIPDGVEGVSLVPTLRGENVNIRDWVHSEHGGATHSDTFHMLTNGNVKYIWNRRTGAEQFFDLCEDRTESHNLAADPERQDDVLLWRTRMIEGQVQHRKIPRKLIQPKCGGRLELFPFIPFGFDPCIVGNAIGWFQLRFFPGAEGGIDPTEIVHDYIDRPPVAHQVVPGKNQQMFILLQGQQPRAQQRSVFNIKRIIRFAAQNFLQAAFPCLFALAGQISKLNLNAVFICMFIFINYCVEMFNRTTCALFDAGVPPKSNPVHCQGLSAGCVAV